MASECLPTATIMPEALGLQIASKAAFSASRTELEARKKLAQHGVARKLLLKLKRRNEQNHELQKLQHVMELKQRDKQILELQRARTMDLQRFSDAARSASAQQQSELVAYDKNHQEQVAELAVKDLQIEDLSNAIERVVQEKRDLEGLLAGTQQALEEHDREVALAAYVARLALKQHREERNHLQKRSREHVLELEQRQACIQDSQSKLEGLKQGNSNLECEVLKAQEQLADKEQDLRHTKLNLAAAKAALNEQINRQSAAIRSLEEKTRRLTDYLEDAEQSQSRMSAELEDAAGGASRSRAIEQELKRECALSSDTIGKLHNRVNELTQELLHAKDAHADTKAELCKATESMVELQAAKAVVEDDNSSLIARPQQLELDGTALAGERTHAMNNHAAPRTSSRTDAAMNYQDFHSIWSAPRSRSKLLTMSGLISLA